MTSAWCSLPGTDLAASNLRASAARSATRRFAVHVAVPHNMVPVPLVITRCPGEQLIRTTPDGLRIVIEPESAPLKGEGAVKLVIDAPREVQVLRGELEHRR